jgi:biopolymer transport protein TolR
VVPYIDVMLVLLVIFMVTAPLITPGVIELPSVGQAANVPLTPIEIQITEDGKLSWRKREPGAVNIPVERSALAQTILSELKPDQPVVIAALIQSDSYNGLRKAILQAAATRESKPGDAP